MGSASASTGLGGPSSGATSPTPSGLPVTPTPESSAVVPTQSPSPIPTTSSPIVDGLIVDWQERSDADVQGIDDFWASTALPSRFVAVGSSNTAGSGIWTSANGLRWNSATVPAAQGFTSTTVFDVTVGGPGVAVLTDGRQGAQEVGLVYLSADGRTWTAVESPEFAGYQFERIGHAGTTLVIFGSAYPHGAIWASADGTSWEQASDPAADGIAENLLALESHGSQLWAFTMDLSSGSPGKTQVWTTTDGLTWHNEGDLPGSMGMDHLSVAAGPLGWIAVGANDTTWLAWRSDDGLTWSRVRPAPWGRLEGSMADQAGFVAVGWYSTRRDGCVLADNTMKGVTWTSSDGSSWREMPNNGWRARQVEMLRRDGRTLFGLGLDYTKSQATGAVWTAQLPATSQDVNPPPAYPAPPYDPAALDCQL